MDEPIVSADATATDSTPELSSVDPSLSLEDTSSDETLTQDEQPTKAPRAQERITELVRERNELRASLESMRSQYSSSPTPNQPTFDGVTDEGIDPVKYGQSLMQNARTEAQRAVAFEVQRMDVAKDPLMANQYAQLQVSALIDRGFSPMDALDAYKDQMSEMEKEIAKKQRSRDEAGKFVRDTTGITPAGKTAATPGSFTNAQIEAMSQDEYAKNRDEIKRQMSQGLIK